MSYTVRYYIELNGVPMSCYDNAWDAPTMEPCDVQTVHCMVAEQALGMIDMLRTTYPNQLKLKSKVIKL